MPSRFGTGPFGKTLYSAGYVYDASGSFAFLFGFAGSAALPINISGTMAIQFGFAAHANNALALSGSFPILVGFTGGRFNGDFIIAGDMDFALGLVGSAVAGPLWGQDALCAGQWGPDALCADPGWGPDPDIPVSAPWAPSELCDG